MRTTSSISRDAAKTIERISPENGRNMTVKYGKQTTLRQVIGVWPEFGVMRNLVPQYGSRFINERTYRIGAA